MTGSRGALGLLAAAVVGLAGACATPSSGGPGPAGAGSPPAVAGAPSEQAAPSQPAASSEQAAIYTAVLRRYLTTGDNSFGDDHRFPVAYVLDHTDAAAADPMGGARGPATPIPAADQAAILAGLADVGRVEFIADRASVIEEPDGCARVRGDGILVVLGPRSRWPGIGRSPSTGSSPASAPPGSPTSSSRRRRMADQRHDG